MGGNFWHEKCWDSLTNAVCNALKDEQYYGQPLQEAVMRALKGLKPLCETCKESGAKKIEKWLGLELESGMVDKVLKDELGQDVKGWLTP